MILILSSNEKEAETDLVCRGLFFQKIDFLRLNVDDFLNKNCLVTDQYFVIEDKKYFYGDFDLIWVRRNITSLNTNFKGEDLDYRSNLSLNIFNFREWNTFIKYFFTRFPAEKMVNRASSYFLSKVEQLDVAREVGLSVPNSLFANSAQQLQSHPQGTELINKSANNLGYIQRNGKTHKAYTEVVSPDTIPNQFLVSFFQEKVEGIHEVRTLYLDGKLYNCGLIKPENADNHVDVKKQSDLRCHPIDLPPEFEEGVRAFMQRIGFRIGFLDLIKTDKGYRFIEMNPYGKYLYYSHACNFNFEHRITNFLIHEAAQQR